MANNLGNAYAGSNFSVMASAARTATPDTQEYELTGHYRALHLVIDVTAITSTPSITIDIFGVDRVSGKTYAVLTSAAISTVSTTVLRVGQGLTASANVTANDAVPPIIRIRSTHGNANSITYSIAALLCS